MAASPSSPPSSSSAAERRSYWVAAIVLFGTLAVGITLTALFAPSDTPHGKASANSVEAKVRIIPRPNEGHAPRNPGDRGGWEQLATLATIAGGIGLLVLLVWRSSRKARTRL